MYLTLQWYPKVTISVVVVVYRLVKVVDRMDDDGDPFRNAILACVLYCHVMAVFTQMARGDEEFISFFFIFQISFSDI